MGNTSLKDQKKEKIKTLKEKIKTLKEIEKEIRDLDRQIIRENDKNYRDRQTNNLANGRGISGRYPKGSYPK